jgi:hypothetical protein
MLDIRHAKSIASARLSESLPMKQCRLHICFTVTSIVRHKKNRLQQCRGRTCHSGKTGVGRDWRPLAERNKVLPDELDPAVGVGRVGRVAVLQREAVAMIDKGLAFSLPAHKPGGKRAWAHNLRWAARGKGVVVYVDSGVWINLHCSRAGCAQRSSRRHRLPPRCSSR